MTLPADTSTPAESTRPGAPGGRETPPTYPDVGDLLASWVERGGRGRQLVVTPSYDLRDSSGRQRYLSDLTVRVAGWDAALQIWHGPAFTARSASCSGGTDSASMSEGEADRLTRFFERSSRARATVLIPKEHSRTDPRHQGATPAGRDSASDPSDSSNAADPTDDLPGFAEQRGHITICAASDPDDSTGLTGAGGAGGTVAAVWAVTSWPGAMTVDWASPLTRLAHHVVLHTRPVDPQSAQRLLRRRLSALASTRLLDERSGRLTDPELEVAATVAADLREALARGTTRLLYGQLLLVLHGADPAELADRGQRLRDTARGLLTEVRPLTFQHAAAWAAALPGGAPLRWPWRLLDAASIAATIPLPVGPPAPARPPRASRPSSQQTSSRRSRSIWDASGTNEFPAPVLAGIDPGSGAPLLADRWNAHNPCRLVVGTSGAGKSYAAKLELMRQRVRGVRGVVVDPEGEFGALTRSLGGLVLEVGEEPVGLDPVGLATRPRTPAAEGLAVLVSWAGALLAEPLSAVDIALLDRALSILRPDHPPGEHPRTHAYWARTAELSGLPRNPLTAALNETASAADLLAVIGDLVAYPPFVGADLPARLSPAAGGTLGALFAPNPDLIDPPDLVCFDLRAVAGRIRPAVMATVLAWTWTLTMSSPVNRPGPPTLLVLDEAHLLLDDPAAADLIAQFARRARKYRVGVELVTQRLSDFLTHPSGQAVLANTATKLLLGCEDHERTAVTTGLGLTAAEAAWLTPAARSRGRGLLLTPDWRSPVQIVAGPNEHRLASAPPRR